MTNISARELLVNDRAVMQDYGKYKTGSIVKEPVYGLEFVVTRCEADHFEPQYGVTSYIIYGVPKHGRN